MAFFLYGPKEKTTQWFKQDPCFNQTNKPQGKTSSEAASGAVGVSHCLLFPQLS